MTQQHDIYLRAFATQLDAKQRKSARQDDGPKWPNSALVLDCESRITEDQTLTFGFWRFCELRNDGYVCTEEGIFHDGQSLSAREFEFLRQYARATKPETTDDGSPLLAAVFAFEVCSRSPRDRDPGKGTHRVLQCGIRFEPPRSRLGNRRQRRLVAHHVAMAQTRTRGKLKPNKYFPRIVVKALNSKTSIIHSTRAPMSEPSEETKKAKLWPAGRFLGPSHSIVDASQQIVFA